MDFEALAAMVVTAFIITTIVEAIVKPIWERLHLDKFWILYVILVLGSALGWFTELNGFPILKEEIIGRILSSLAIGLGPSFIYDNFLDKDPSE